MKKFIFYATLVALFTSCMKDDVVVDAVQRTEDFIATFADDTRADLDGTAVVWNADDHLTIFTKTSHNRQYKVKNLSANGRSATFEYVGYTGSDKTAISNNYAVYPYDAEATILGDVITTTLASEQTYNAECDLTYALMSAKSATNNFSFVNSGALLRFNISTILPDTFELNYIKVSSQSHNIAGEVTIDTNDHLAVVANNGTNEITLAEINATIDSDVKSFYIAMPAMSFEKSDLSVTFSFADGNKTFALPAFDLEQGKIKSIDYSIKDAEEFTGSTPGEDEPAAAKPANNEIWYTNGSTTESTTPNKADVFGANIVSNTYDAEKECWVIKFDGDVTTIGDWAFYNCSSLTSITIPDSVTEIGWYVFDGCSSLTNIELGDNVTSIGHYAFYGCCSLTSITIPESVIEIENNPFNGCTSLKEFKGPYAVNSGCALVLGKSFVAFAPGNNTEEIQIYNGITTIASAAFQGCSTLESIELPESLLIVGDSAFSRCSGLTSITIPKNVKVLGGTTFYKCENLQNVYCECVVPPTCGSRSFYNNSSELKIYVYEECIDTYKAQWENYSDKIVAQGNIPNPDVTTSIYYTTTDEQIVEISTLPIKSNTYNNGLGELVVYGELTSIPTYTFADCDRLKTITIPNSVTEIGLGALFSCDNIESFSGKFASEDGRYIIIDNKLCYAAKANLPKVVSIPDNIIVIGENAFSDCSTIEEVVIPNSVIKIDMGAFVGCRNLWMVNLGNSVQEILDNAFANTRLASIYIPKSVNDIGAFAFSSTYSVSFQATTPPSSVAVPYAFPTEASIYVPNSAKEAYIAQWGGFYSNIVGY